MLEKAFEIPKEIWKSRKLVWTLARNDFKSRFAGSYLGIVWALVQPIVTVLVYWFVFQVGLRQTATYGDGCPFVLWMLAGLVPWFYFQETMLSGCGVLSEYSYLVKKVVFKIEILPAVKMISALFIHLFFVGIALLLFLIYGKLSPAYAWQVFYYTFCMWMLVLGISYATSAVNVFFRDLMQMINIAMQVGVWVTPIMWNMADLNLPRILTVILKLNPMYYICYGYRDALVYKVYFWERTGLTMYFWAVTLICLLVGTNIFKRLRVHFADVL